MLVRPSALLAGLASVALLSLTGCGGEGDTDRATARSAQAALDRFEDALREGDGGRVWDGLCADAQAEMGENIADMRDVGDEDELAGGALTDEEREKFDEEFEGLELTDEEQRQQDLFEDFFAQPVPADPREAFVQFFGFVAEYEELALTPVLSTPLTPAEVDGVGEAARGGGYRVVLVGEGTRDQDLLLFEDGRWCLGSEEQQDQVIDPDGDDLPLELQMDVSEVEVAVRESVESDEVELASLSCTRARTWTCEITGETVNGGRVDATVDVDLTGWVEGDDDYYDQVYVYDEPDAEDSDCADDEANAEEGYRSCVSDLADD